VVKWSKPGESRPTAKSTKRVDMTESLGGHSANEDSLELDRPSQDPCSSVLELGCEVFQQSSSCTHTYNQLSHMVQAKIWWSMYIVTSSYSCAS
jgi:hypothetical protein